MNELIECQRDDRLALSSSDYIITMMKIIMQTSPGSPMRMTRQNTTLSKKFDRGCLFFVNWKSNPTAMKASCLESFNWRGVDKHFCSDTTWRFPPRLTPTSGPCAAPWWPRRWSSAPSWRRSQGPPAGWRPTASSASSTSRTGWVSMIHQSECEIDLATLRFLRISHSRGNICPCDRPGCGFRWSMSSGAAWGSRRRSTPGLRSSSSSHPTRSWWTTSAPRDTNWIRWGGGG